MRGKCNAAPVANGVISVGDAWVDDGEIGNVPALANGVYAGRVIIEAARKNDFSEEALKPAKDFITKKFLTALAQNKKSKLLCTKFNEEELKQMFLFMQHMDYPVMMFGSSTQRGLMLTHFMMKNFFRFFKHPRIARSMF